MKNIYKLIAIGSMIAIGAGICLAESDSIQGYFTKDGHYIGFNSDSRYYSNDFNDNTDRYYNSKRSNRNYSRDTYSDSYDEDDYYYDHRNQLWDDQNDYYYDYTNYYDGNYRYNRDDYEQVMYLNYDDQNISRDDDGYYVYDYPREYYDIQDEIRFDTNNCYENDNGARMCHTKFLSKNNYGMYFKRYNCTYNIKKKGNYCIYDFKKSKQYVLTTKDTRNDDYYISYGSRYLNNGQKLYIIPNHSHVIDDGNDWECNWGYEKSHNSNYCQKVYLPYNSHISEDGKGWSCNYGYKKESGECVKIRIPRYGYLNPSGNDWNCVNGYYKDTDDEICRKQ